MTDPKRSLKVFLCHAHADRDAVRSLYTRLTKDGVDAWLDKEKLLPGQDWELEIRKAVRQADVVVVCLSKQFNQAGFRQKEVRLALDTAMEKPEGEIFIIPARLEECDTLESLRKWHWVDLFEVDGYEMLMRALRARANKIGAALSTRKIWQFQNNYAISRKKTDIAHSAKSAYKQEKILPNTTSSINAVVAETEVRKNITKITYKYLSEKLKSFFKIKWLLWSFLTAFGVFVGQLSSLFLYDQFRPSNSSLSLFQMVLVWGVCYGLFIGIGQWLLLPFRYPVLRWIMISILAWMFNWFLAMKTDGYVSLRFDENTVDLISSIALGASIALPGALTQWYLLYKREYNLYFFLWLFSNFLTWASWVAIIDETPFGFLFVVRGIVGVLSMSIAGYSLTRNFK